MLLLAIGIGIYVGLDTGGVRGMVIMGMIFFCPLCCLHLFRSTSEAEKEHFRLRPSVGFSYGFVTFLSGNALFSDIRPEIVWLAA